MNGLFDKKNLFEIKSIQLNLFEIKLFQSDLLQINHLVRLIRLKKQMCHMVKVVGQTFLIIKTI